MAKPRDSRIRPLADYRKADAEHVKLKIEQVEAEFAVMQGELSEVTRKSYTPERLEVLRAYHAHLLEAAVYIDGLSE